MNDVFSKEKRSEIMSHIRSKDTKPEIAVRKYLFSKGFRYRKNDKRYPGTPDIVLPKYKTVIFVHGCFWHGHEGCKYSKMPKTNIEYWERKISRNKVRDLENIRLLEDFGFRVIVILECEMKYDFEQRMTEIINQFTEGFDL